MNRRGIILFFLAGTVLTVSGWFAFRNLLLEHKLNSLALRLQEERTWVLTWEEASWAGINTVKIKMIEIKAGNDTQIFLSHNFIAKLSVLSLLVAKAKPEEIHWDSADISIPRGEEGEAGNGDPIFDFALRIRRLLEKWEARLPLRLDLYATTILLPGESGTNNIVMDSLFANAKGSGGNFTAHGLCIKHSAIADSVVVFPLIESEYVLSGDGEKTILEKGSFVKIGQWIWEPHADVDFENKILEAGIRFPETEVRKILASFPAGTMESFSGFAAEGKWGGEYAIRYAPESDHPVTLTGKTSGSNFSILKFGRANPGYLLHDFAYNPIHSNKPRIVNPDSPEFVHLAELPVVLQEAVLLSEDAGFREHDGLNFEAMEFAARENIRERSFVRGGSTIEMQLIRNLFLNHRKKISRKIEEIALTWCFGKAKVLTKDEVLELYLNIIEWGPGIYGIREASEFYFQKAPGVLNPSECIFLAGIIPNPLMYNTFRDEAGLPTEFAESYFAGMALQLYLQGDIDEKTMDEIAMPQVLCGVPKFSAECG